MTLLVAVLGAGSWGTAVADHLARSGHDVRIWAREPEVVESINRRHENERFLAGTRLAPGLRATGELGAAARGAGLVVSAAPSHAVRDVVRSAAGGIAPGAIVVSISKGLEAGSLLTMSQVLAAECPAGQRVVALSGPSFAGEVAARQPTAVVVASAVPEAAQATQQAFAGATFRVYSHDDVVGVELGGALKNVVAIAAGMLEGLGLGHNPRAALITRGLAEMTRLGVAMGAHPMTFAGLAGLGDLVLTATGAMSRNRSLGVELGRGRSLQEVMGERVTVAEGVHTAQAAVTLGRRYGVELPIAEQVAEILFDGKQVGEAVAELMERELKAEQWR